jgi:LysW-gamma-L-alpha-aminoadipyl-6-phosphate/LysW-L-glutamyl-5-phosphate reductase
MEKTKVSIIGASGYVGGEALRLLLQHPNVEVVQVTSESNAGKFVKILHPNLRGLTNLKFTSIKNLENVDCMFVALPHKVSSELMPKLMKHAKKIIDKGSDFRLSNKNDYDEWYDFTHPYPELLEKFVYGIPELHSEKIKKANYVAAAGCNATATILGLYPLYKNKLIDEEKSIVEVKAGSSQGGAKFNSGTHHPERNDAMRSYKPTGHRHMAEIIEQLNTKYFGFSATSMPLVRGILMTGHVFLNDDISEKDIWKTYRETYANCPFIRIVKERQGIYRYPEPKLLWGTNYCDIGFKRDERTNRLVVISAIDNLMKGAAGQAVQCMNLMFDFPEEMGLEFPGLHPI